MDDDVPALASARLAGNWTVADVVDFESLVARGAADDEAVVDACRGALPSAIAANERRTVLLDWLHRTRARTDAPRPGDLYRSGVRGATVLAALVGLLLGASLAGKLLSPGDVEPVNALLFLGCTAGLQVALLIAVAIAWTLRSAGLRIGWLQDAMLVLVGAFGRLAKRLHGVRRQRAHAAWAAIDVRSGRLAPLVACDLLSVTQGFAVAFNGGLLAAMLLVHLPFEELRFGWQSTYSFTTDGVTSAVRLIASPWRWIADGLVPDAGEVEATRYTRGQAAATLPAAPARAWWPFLLCAVAFYGLAIRALLAVVARLVLRGRLARLRFDHAAAHALWRRLQGPLFRAAGRDDALPDGRPVATAHGGPVDLFVVDRELGARGPAFAASLASPVPPIVVADIDDDALSAELKAALRNGAVRVVVAAPASRDPIVAVAGFLQALVDAAGTPATITVVLVDEASGEPRPAAVATATSDRLAIWTRFVAIQRLPVVVERLR